MSEKYSLNGRTYPLETYGATQKKHEDRVRIIPDEQSSATSDADIAMESHSSTRLSEEKDNYFQDGERKIDFVLVYEEESGTQKSLETQKGSVDHKRYKFLESLRKAGLQTEEERVTTEKRIITYIKLFAPWEVLIFYAEDLCMRAPLQAHPNPSSNWSDKILRTIHVPNMLHEDVPNKPLDYYTCPFKKSKLDRFLGSNNRDTYFSTTQRSRIVWEILATAAYGKRKRAEIGIERLIEEDVYAAAFPLHDGPYELPKFCKLDPDQLNPRQILYEYWASWGKWNKYQPLDHIREYFGEKIGIYFAWLGFYTAWLLPAAVVGVIVFLYGVFTMYDNIPANEICESNKTYKMCPLCEETIGCPYWYLSEVCIYTRVAYLFDHPATVFYSIFVSFWAVTFLEYWKRKNASLAHHWDVSDYEEEEERPRPEYAAKAPTYEENPITRVKEPHFPPRKRLPRILSGIAVIVVMMTLVIIFIIAVIMYRVLVSIPLFENDTTRARAQIIASMSAAVVNLIVIMILGRIYEKLALKMTQWEMHKTQTEFEDQLTFKVFIFQFVNFYSSIIYIAFFKGRFVGYPGHYTKFFGLRSEDCNNGGCLVELAQQLAVIMIGKQIINNAQEIIVPKVKAFIHRMKIQVDRSHIKARWEEDYNLIENEGLFQEYLEMVLQFGFITIFVAAFPLAPLFALLNNWLEIRIDAHKFTCETRRPVADRAQDIGVWFSIMDALAQIAVISNAFLIAFTSEFLPRLLYRYQYNWNLEGYTNFTLATAPNGTLTQTCRYKAFRDDEGSYTMFFWHLLAVRLAFVIIFEHVVFGVCRLIDIMVPDVPESLSLKIKRERYLAKQALTDTDTIMQKIKAEWTKYDSDSENDGDDDVEAAIARREDVNPGR
ncbi:anoctamin-7-like isoform X2 [Mya arenaria]|uniref:anoctamin-7-like isoform X2 n=1 Tax=Mya arenaria TaxID=6604 RepID=UPI0022E23C99|nr:anoctamin-7-like isoform X2 [Mya arenaria]